MIELPLAPVLVWMMIFFRAGFVLSFFPLIGEHFVPVRIRLVLAAMLAMALTPVSPLRAEMFPSSGGALALMIATEALLGLSVGLLGRVLFAIIQFSGQLAGEQMGFGIINAIDPTGSHQISVVAEMQYILSILLFLVADLHHGFLRVIAESYQVLPPGGAALTSGLVGYMMRLGETMFALSVQFAMPVIIIIFAINVGLGLIARAVPQINVFLESFPLRIIAGIAVLMLSLGFTVTLWEDLFAGLPERMMQLARIMAG